MPSISQHRSGYSSLQQLQLPHSKLMRLKDTLSTWTSRKCCTKKKLESLIGLLHDASIFIRASQTFIYHLIDLLKSSNCRPSSLDSIVRLGHTFFGGIPLFQTGTVYLWCKVRGNQTLILPSLQMHRVHGAVVHTGIPIRSSTSGQNTPFPIVRITTKRAAANLSCGCYMGTCVERQGCFMPLWQWGCGDYHQLRHKQGARSYSPTTLLILHCSSQ